MPCCYVVLPVYNEIENLEALFAALELTFSEDRMQAWQRHYVAVDDGSSDGSGEWLQQTSSRLPMTIVTHKKNAGLGTTLRDGFQEACQQGRPEDVLLCMDADHTQPPEYIPDMIQILQQGAEVVIASRYQKGSEIHGLSLFRGILSRIAATLFSLRFSIPKVRDYTCGYRAYSMKLLQDAFSQLGNNFMSQEGFQCSPDILLSLHVLTRNFAEIPFILRYDRKQGASKMPVLKTAFQTLKLVLKKRAPVSSTEGREHD